jgi:hypothetical protein
MSSIYPSATERPHSVGIAPVRGLSKVARQRPLAGGIASEWNCCRPRMPKVWQANLSGISARSFCIRMFCTASCAWRIRLSRDLMVKNYPGQGARRPPEATCRGSQRAKTASADLWGS